MRCRFISILLLLGISLPLHAQTLPPDLRACGTTATPRAVLAEADGETGGRHLTAKGTLRILIVFASFPDDETPNPDWPAHHPPLFMNQFIDSDTLTQAQGSFNLTNYFRRMSLDQFHLIGDAIWVESRHSQLEYSTNGSYGRANSALLKEQVDSLVDFSRFDAWTNLGDYANQNVSDSLVDMIVMVWRTQIFPSVGEASLGRLSTFILDGERVGMGFPEDLAHPVGSGVTCEYLYDDTPQKVMRTIAHEIGHWLLGGPHPYNDGTLSGKHEFWGMLCSGHRISSCVNTYEREKLGWITVPMVRPDSTYTLSDYVTTGEALKYHPQNGSPYEYFYFENHQMHSEFDDVTTNRGDRGLWVLHQQGPYMELDNLRIEPADGDWKWESPGVVSSCYGAVLPMFVKGWPDVQTGQSHRDMIPTTTSDVNWISVMNDPFAGTICGQFFAGDSFSGAFNQGGGNVFSHYSNPPSSTWSRLRTDLTLEVTGEINGVLTVQTFSDSLSSSPARRYLGQNPSHSRTGGASVSLAWGDQWPGGQPLEPDMSESELDRQIGRGGVWERVYLGPSTGWTDSAFAYDSLGTELVSYRVRVSNRQGRFSSWSNVSIVPTSPVSAAVGGESGAIALPLRFGLVGVYPNPFNPSTVISGQWTVDSRVKLAVYDLLGREVAVLADGRFPAGVHSFVFDGSGLASGVYFCRLTAGNSADTRMMTLAK